MSRQFIPGPQRRQQLFTFKFTYADNYESSSHMHVFGQWEEAREPGLTPRRHSENRKTPHRKVQFRLSEVKLIQNCVHILNVYKITKESLLGLYAQKMSVYNVEV